MVIHDVSPSRRVSHPAVLASLSAALRMRGTSPPAGAAGRYDSDGPVAFGDAIEAYHRHVDRAALRELGNGLRLAPEILELARRHDALPAGAGGFPRDFEFQRSAILEEKRQPLTAMAHFPIDSSVPLGAKTHTARRALGNGEAQIYRGGSEIPRATVAYAEETFGTAIVVCAVETNYFDALTTDFAGLRQFESESRLAVRLVDERVNRVAWFGDVASQVYGFINYPGLAKTILTTAFVDATSATDVCNALGDFCATPMVESGGTFGANALLVSPKIGKYIGTRPTTLAANMSIAELFLKGQQYIGGVSSIAVAPELAGIGPSGEDGMLAYRKDLDTCGHVLIQQTTALPVVQQGPLDMVTVYFAVTGGATMFDSGNCILGYVDVTP